jgi:hypothetical protein
MSDKTEIKIKNCKRAETQDTFLWQSVIYDKEILVSKSFESFTMTLSHNFADIYSYFATMKEIKYHL